MASSAVIEFGATGRRKTASARARLVSGLGVVKVNGKPLDQYFESAMLQEAAVAPLKLTEMEKAYDAAISVKGGGKAGQSGACAHALSRALVAADETLKPALKAAGFLTRDSRMKERKKPGQPGARKRFQFSKR